MARDETQNSEGATVENLATEQKRRWSSGDAVTVEELLREFRHPTLDAADLAQLAYSEYEFRLAVDDNYDVEALFTRFSECEEQLRELVNRHVPDDLATVVESSRQAGTVVEAPDDPQSDRVDGLSDVEATMDDAGEVMAQATVVDGTPNAKPPSLLSTRISSGNTSTVQTFVTPSESQADRFELKDEIARGSMGRIVHAYDERIRRDVAYKELLPRSAMNRDSRSRFVEEAQITGQLEHSGIVPIYEMGINDEGAPYYVMKLVRGETFEDTIQAWHAMPESDPHRRMAFNALLRHFIDICNTLAFAHENDVIHRDLKPQNVMLGEFGETLVLDWGLAKVIKVDSKAGETSITETSDGESDLDDEDSIGSDLADQAFGATVDVSGPGGSDTAIPKPRSETYGARSVSTDERLTRTRHGSILGTPSYMSPEQARGRHDRLDARSDVYALGAILYRLLTDQAAVGKPKSARDALRAARDGQVTPPREIKPQIPRPLEAICMKALQRDVDDRYQTAIELKNDVEAWLADETISVYVEPLPQRVWRFIKRHRFAVAVSAAVLVTGTVVPVAVKTYRQSETTESVNELIAEADVAEAAQKFEAAQSLLANAEGLASNEPGLSDLARTVSNRRRLLEEQLREQAVSAREEAIASRNQAVENSLLAEARRLVAESRSAKADKPRLSLLLAGEAVELSRRTGREVVPEAVQNLHDVIGKFGGRGLHQHTGPIRALAISADGKWMLSGSADRRARLWRLDGSGDSAELFGHEGTVTAVLMTPDGRYAVTAGDDGAVALWDVNLEAQPDPVHVLLASELPVTCMAVSPDGRWLATSGLSADIKIWDLMADKPDSTVKQLEEHSDAVNTLQFSPDGKTLFSGSDDRVVAAWSIPAQGEPPVPSRLLTGHVDGVTTLDLSDDGKWLVSGDAEGGVRLWKTGNADAEPIVLATGRHAVARVQFAPVAGLFAVATASGECSIWEIAGSECDQVGELSDHTASINDMLWLTSPLRIVTASDDRTVRIRNWPGDPDSPGSVLRVHEDSVWALAASANGDTLAGGALDGAIQVWETVRAFPGMTPGLVNGHDRQVQELAVSHDGQWLLSISSDRNRPAQLWRHDGRLRLQRSDAFAAELESLGRVTTASWHPTRSLFAIATFEGLVAVLDPTDPAASQRVLHGMDLDKRVTDIVFSPSGDTIAACNEEGQIAVWNITAANVEPLRSVQGSSDDQTRIAFAPDGNAIAIGDHSGGVYVLPSGADAARLLPGSHKRAVNQIAFSPDGNWLGSVSDDGSLHLWKRPQDSAAEQSPQILVRHTERIYSLMFSPDSRHVLTVSDSEASDGEVAIVWPVGSSHPERDAVVLSGHSKGVRCMAMLKHGRMVATGSDDGTLRLWDLSLDNPSAASILIRDFGESVRALAVDETSSTLFVGTRTGSVAVWPLDISSLVQAARKTAGRALTESEQTRFQPDVSAFQIAAERE